MPELLIASRTGGPGLVVVATVLHVAAASRYSGRRGGNR